LKDDSIKNIITFQHLSDVRKKINIKVELDSNPPRHAHDETNFLDFPTDYSIRCHDRSSLMSGKLHALLCRSYIKGRHWYDFSWYISQKIKPNYQFLKEALKQQGPWVGQEIEMNREWPVKVLEEKVNAVPWKETSQDVTKFLRPEKKQEVEALWSKEFFISKIEKIVS
jgi:hypothetical protein